MTKHGTKHSWVIVVKGIQVCSNEGPCPFPRGDNFEIAKIHWQNLKIFFSRTTWPISIENGIKHPWVKGIQICSNEGPRLFPRGDNWEVLEINWQLFFFSWTTGPISTNSGLVQMTSHSFLLGLIIAKKKNNPKIHWPPRKNILYKIFFWSKLILHSLILFRAMFCCSGKQHGPWASCLLCYSQKLLMTATWFLVCCARLWSHRVLTAFPPVQHFLLHKGYRFKLWGKVVVFLSEH